MINKKSLIEIYNNSSSSIPKLYINILYEDVSYILILNFNKNKFIDLGQRLNYLIENFGQLKK